MKKRTLGFKLVAGGIAVVLIPLLVVGLFSVNKATNALVTLSEEQAVNIAKDRLELDINEVDVNMRVVDDLGLNSLTIFDFIYETEKIFQIELDEKSLLKVKTVNDMIKLIQKNLH